MEAPQGDESFYTAALDALTESARAADATATANAATIVSLRNMLVNCQRLLDDGENDAAASAAAIATLQRQLDDATSQKGAPIRMVLCEMLHERLF